MAWYEILMWIAAVFAGMVVLVVALIFFAGVSMFNGDADTALLAQIAGLLLTILLLPFLVLVGVPLCLAWPVQADAKPSDLRSLRITKLFTWWRHGFKFFNE